MIAVLLPHRPRLFNIRFKSRQSGVWSVQPGVCSLQSGVCSLESGVCSLSLQFWSLQSGVCSLESGVCSLECGVCSLDSGALIASCSLSSAHSQSKHAKNRKVPSDHRFKRHLEIKINAEKFLGGPAASGQPLQVPSRNENERGKKSFADRPPAEPPLQ